MGGSTQHSRAQPCRKRAGSLCFQSRTSERDLHPEPEEKIAVSTGQAVMSERENILPKDNIPHIPR